MNKEALGESTEATEDRDILLGSYIFLRYYSPAIITPEEYGILLLRDRLKQELFPLFLVPRVLSVGIVLHIVI